MTYKQAVQYLYDSVPMFQNIGAGAYKEGLYNSHTLDQHFGHPHRCYQTIHVAGTNGKGSVSHTLAAILQQAGYRVGLYTSPHLTDFRERIRVNGKMIPQKRVVRFVEEERSFFEPLHPSFFELTTALAFLHFKEEGVQIAVIETGLGGRLDCTNIITPILSIITNISKDHTQFLGHTYLQIATEKAGIIKPQVPVVIGETGRHANVRRMFLQRAADLQSPITLAEESGEVLHSTPTLDGGRIYTTKHWGRLKGQLGGLCQTENTATILSAVSVLTSLGLPLTRDHVAKAMRRVCSLTGLMGRWQTLQRRPNVVCDTGHNIGGFQYLVKQIVAQPHKRLHIVFGMVADKDINAVLHILPREATYYFTQSSVKRSMPAAKLAQKAEKTGLAGSVFTDVTTAYKVALSNASEDDFIFVGGSSYVVADLLNFLK